MNTTTPQALPAQNMIDAATETGRALAIAIRDEGNVERRDYVIEVAHKRSDSKRATVRAWAHAVLDVFGICP